MKASQKSSLIILILWESICHLTHVATLVTEDFEGDFGAQVFLFSDVYRSGSGQFVHDDLSGIANSPAGPQIPIASGGDRELRYFDGPEGTAGGHSMIVAPRTSSYSDSLITGYLGNAFVSPRGGMMGGLMSRVTGVGANRSGYAAVAFFHAFGPDTVYFALADMHDGNIGVNPSFSISGGSYGLDLSEENIYAELLTEGDLIRASFWRVSPDGDQHFLESLTASDDTYREGANGLVAFVRGQNSILFDDVSVLQIPEPSSSLLLILSFVPILQRQRL